MSVQEGLLNFPATLDGRQLFSPVQRGRLDSEGRQLLKIMSAVSRDWNTVAQTILRRRCGAHSLQELEALLRSSYCGNWVQEFQFVMGTCAAEGLIDSPDNPFGALATALIQLPSLRALSLAMSNLNPDISVLCSVLQLIPRALQSLHVHQTYWTEHALCQLYDTVSHLHCLNTLSIMGNSFKLTASPSQPPMMCHTSPPASLKRLLLHFSTVTEGITPYLSWLFLPRGGFSLHELRLRHHAELAFSGFDYVCTLCDLTPTLMPALHDLKVLEVRVTTELLDWPYLLSSPLASLNLLKYCTSLEELHANVIDALCVLELPGSLQRLHVLKSFDKDISSEDTKLLIVLTRMLCHWNLQSVVVSELEAGMNFPRSEELCNEAGVKYTVIRR